MTQSKHTPGPWSVLVNDEDLWLIEHENQQIAAVSGQFVADDYGNCPLEPEEMANARLIAAAPDLLEALTKLALATSSVGVGHISMNQRTALKEARVAIAKAKGESK